MNTQETRHSTVAWQESPIKLFPGITPEDAACLAELGDIVRQVGSDATIQELLDSAFINPHTSAGILRYNATRADEQDDLFVSELHARRLALNAARNGLAWRITANSSIKEMIPITPEAIPALKQDFEFRERSQTYQCRPTDRYSYLRMQSRLLGFSAAVLAGVERMQPPHPKHFEDNIDAYLRPSYGTPRI